MGTIYKKIGAHVKPGGSGVFVEIGSDRGEGSTVYLNNLAAQHNTKLITVDIAAKARHTLGAQLTNTEFVVANGSDWANDFAITNPDIDVLYLDNFDYIWDITNISRPIQIQMHEYSQRGAAMTNQACQIEHLRQLMLLYPRLTTNAVVAFDDTYCWNDCWVGKCGPAVVYMLASGWRVVEQTLDCGVILSRD
jgi:hypothetical protein